MIARSARNELILVVDDDADIARFIEVNLRVHGFDVMVARDGVEALHLAGERPPDLALVDLMMPRLNGLDLTKRLRASPLTTAMPVIMLTARGLTADKVLGLTAGADDYLVKPFDVSELVARIVATLRRHQEYREISPLTGLPGNTRIQQEIADRLAAGTDFALGYIDIDRFKSVNDAYGFGRGDEFISALARSLRRAVMEVGLPPAFLGHVGGDDFVIVCEPAQLRPLTERAVVDFERAADGLYDPVDAARGYVELVDRRGNVQQSNLVTISIGVALSTSRNYADPREVVQVASEMKSEAKKHPGSYVFIDRRSALDTAADPHAA
ncbi:MAG TPA: response regulator [Rugosimonospora sp.]|nr:response regulator [Rugosimonospora sp.]